MDAKPNTVTVMVEIKKSDGNYGTRSGAAWVSVEAGASPESIAEAIQTVDVTFEELRKALQAKFKAGEVGK